MNKSIFLAAASAALVFGTAASAATCFGTERNIVLDSAESCVAQGTGNIGNSGDAIISMGFTEIDDTGDGGYGGFLGGDTSGATSGTIQVSGDLSGFGTVLLGLKIGGQDNINWGVFEIAGPGSYSWSTSGPQREISHVVLYGSTSAVPLPASALLLLGGLGGIAALRRRRKA